MEVIHDAAGQKFYALVGEEEAHLLYQRRGTVLDFQHVFVPPAARGRGIAGRLCMKAFDYARQNGLRVVPTCPFVSGEFLPRFPQYRDLVDARA